MRKFPLVIGVVLLIVALNWLRLYAFAEIPEGTNPSTVLTVSAIVLAVAGLLIWYGFPVRDQALPVGASVDAPKEGFLARVTRSIRDYIEHAAARKREEQARRDQELENARTGELVPHRPRNGRSPKRGNGILFNSGFAS